MKSITIFIFILLIQILCTSQSIASPEAISLCPLCTKEGAVTCPDGFQAICQDETPTVYEPKCIFYENKFIPGCWKFVGINKINFNLSPVNMPPSIMIDVIGGGETYTLNREIIGCKKL